MSRPAPVAELADAGVVYGEEDEPGAVASLAGVDLRLHPGECILLAGASGSGKSTVLRRLNGLIPHFHPARLRGAARVMGLDPAVAPLHDVGLRAATVMQNPRTQFFTGDVDAELAFAGENAGLPPDVVRDRMARATAWAGIGELRGRDLAGLSGGQLQRVACAVALAQDPGLLLLDEPSANLSPAAVGELAEVLRRLKDSGPAMAIAEHRLHYLRGIVDRALIFDAGRVRRRLGAAELWALPDAERGSLGLRDLHDTPMPEPDEVIGAAGGGTTTPAGSPAVELHGVLARIRGRTILDIPRLVFPAGAVTAIIGPNGAGKTTLARVITGLLHPARGTVAVHGAPTRAAGRRAACSLVMQDVSRQLFGESAAAEITVGAPRGRAGGPDVTGLLRRMDLADFAERHPLSLSGGQQQRLVIAAALATGRSVHVLDEPTSGVDAGRMRLIADRLRELARAGDAVLVVTHDAELVRACADRVVLLPGLRPPDGGAAMGP